MQCERSRIERQRIVLVGDPERFGQLARTRAQRFLVMQSAPATATAVAISKREPDLARYVFSATNGEEE